MPRRKPRVGMWFHMAQHCNGGVAVDVAASLYVGDAAGRPKGPTRPKDFSCGDLKFALNLGACVSACGGGRAHSGRRMDRTVAGGRVAAKCVALAIMGRWPLARLLGTHNRRVFGAFCHRPRECVYFPAP